MKKQFFVSLTIIMLGTFFFNLSARPSHKEVSPIKPTMASNKQVVSTLQATYVDPQRGVLAACDSGISSDGLTATQKSPDGTYESTAFGCYIDANGNRNNADTPGCIAACGNVPNECSGLSEVDCMYKIKWFAANADQFGCFNRLKVTNKANGKSVIVVVYDRGPHCNVQPRGAILDLSYPAAFYLEVGDYQMVQVEEVPQTTPLGPTDGTNPAAPGAGTGGGSVGPLTVKVKPKTDNSDKSLDGTDTYVINRAVATAIGGGTGTNPGTGLPGQPLPSTDIAVIKQTLCSSYKVCPTVNIFSPPSGDWTLNGLTALWNVVQKIYASPTYRTYALGNYTLEVSRVGSHPGDGGWAYGVNVGRRTPEYNTIPGSWLIVITNNTVATTGDQAIPYWEWLLAHEIGHAAAWGASDGSKGTYPGQNNFPYNTVVDCTEIVSTYGESSADENYADSVSYYMTMGEEVTGYKGSSSKNLKNDFPCTYNALKQGYFDNVEF